MLRCVRRRRDDGRADRPRRRLASCRVVDGVALAVLADVLGAHLRCRFPVGAAAAAAVRDAADAWWLPPPYVVATRSGVCSHDGEQHLRGGALSHTTHTHTLLSLSVQHAPVTRTNGGAGAFL